MMKSTKQRRHAGSPAGHVFWRHAATLTGLSIHWLRTHIWVYRDVNAVSFNGRTYLSDAEVERISKPVPLAPRKPRIAVSPTVKPSTASSRPLSAAAIKASREVAAKSRMHKRRQTTQQGKP